MRISRSDVVGSGVLIITLTAGWYLIAFVHEYGFLSCYRLPISMVAIDTASMAKSAVRLIVPAFAYYLVLFVVLSWIFKSSNRKLAIYRPLVAAAALALILVFASAPRDLPETFAVIGHGALALLVLQYGTSGKDYGSIQPAGRRFRRFLHYHFAQLVSPGDGMTPLSYARDVLGVRLINAIGVIVGVCMYAYIIGRSDAFRQHGSVRSKSDPTYALIMARQDLAYYYRWGPGEGRGTLRVVDLRSGKETDLLITW